MYLEVRGHSINKMTRKTGQILSGLLTVSGIIHISGLLTNWEYDIYAGVFLIIISGLWLTNDFLKNGKSLSSSGSVTIERLDFKWWRVMELIGVAFLLFLLINNEGQLPDSLLLTFILYLSIILILDHKRNVEISKKYISIDGMTIPFERITTIDFKKGKIIITTDHPINLKPITPISIDLSDFNEENRELLIKQLIGDDATAANTGFI
ncbi:MAG: hypothetical protein QY309_03160 [Cyclobacteriaceae bacterium]|nr:MAG: hypothetical protein QY309_03160 [Cyclobacteriaceae bacterium]